MIWQKLPVYFRLILFWVFLSSIASFPVDWNADTSAGEERAKTCPRNMNAGGGAYQRGHVPLFLPESHPHREEKICPTEGAISGGIIRGTAALQMECEVFKAYGHKFFICIRLWGRRGGRPARLQLRGLSEVCVCGVGELLEWGTTKILCFTIYEQRGANKVSVQRLWREADITNKATKGIAATR